MSFLNSLPSQRKKGKSRHYQKSRSSRRKKKETSANSQLLVHDYGNIETDIDNRGVSGIDNTEHISTRDASLNDSYVEGTNQQHGLYPHDNQLHEPLNPGLPRVSLGNTNYNKQQQQQNVDDTTAANMHDNNNDDLSAAAAYEESEDSVVEATQFQYPLPISSSNRRMMMMAPPPPRDVINRKEDDNDDLENNSIHDTQEQQDKSQDLLVPSPVLSDNVKQSKYDDDNAYDEETVFHNNEDDDDDETVVDNVLNANANNDNNNNGQKIILCGECNEPEEDGEEEMEEPAAKSNRDDNGLDDLMEDEKDEDVAAKSIDKVGEDHRLFTERGITAKKQHPNQQAEMEVANESISTSRDKAAEPSRNNIQHTRSNRVSLPLETKPREDIARRNNNNRLAATESVANNSNAKAGETIVTSSLAAARTSNTNATDKAAAAPAKHSEQPRQGGTNNADEGDDTEFVLTSSDIGDCINAMEVVIKIMKADKNQDVFEGIDIEQWHSIFEDFETYIIALGNHTSAEAQELKEINKYDKVFAIFDRGMDVNHCNAVFIYNMIRTISGGIADNSQHYGQVVECSKKLDHLDACLDMIFGVNDDDDPDSPATVVTVNVSKAPTGNSTVLKFSMTLEPSSRKGDTSMLQQPSNGVAVLPPHLEAISQVFERYTQENTQSLQSQLTSAQETLVATREGAMDLQRQALKLQDDLHDAQLEADEIKTKLEQTEANLGRQKYEFERKEESFKRVKEHYKSEIDRKDAEVSKAKDRYERELREVKAELARVKKGDNNNADNELQTEKKSSSKWRSFEPPERRNTDSQHQRKRKESGGRKDNERQSKHHRTGERHRRQSTPHPNPNVGIAEADEAADDDDQISPSIPRKIEYFAPDRDGSRKKNRQSKQTLSGRQSRSTPHDLQPLRRPRSLSEPKLRGSNLNKDRVYGSRNRRSDEYISDSGGRYGRLGGTKTKERNPLKSLTKNKHDDDEDSDVNLFSEKKDYRSSRRERSARKDDYQQQPNDERNERASNGNNFVSSSKNRKPVTNPYLKQPKSTKNYTKDGEPTFVYQEVVRGKEARAALPGHDCEECRKFLDALGPGFDRDEVVQRCSRHRAKQAPPSTPSNFWALTFIDSVGGASKMSSLSNQSQ